MELDRNRRDAFRPGSRTSISSCEKRRRTFCVGEKTGRF